MFKPAQTSNQFWVLSQGLCIENVNEPVNFCVVKRDPIVELSSAGIWHDGLLRLSFIGQTQA
jgi:hypothetical protein